jgi:hypothetical protein
MVRRGSYPRLADAGRACILAVSGAHNVIMKLGAPMTAQQYRKALQEFELTQGRAGWLFGGKTLASGRRWAAEGPPYHVSLILTLMREYGIDPEDIEELGARWRRKNNK